MNIEIIGKGARLCDAARLLTLTEWGVGYPDSLIILPIPTSRDGVHITGTEIPLSELPLPRGKRSFVAGYGFPMPFRTCLESQGVPFFDAKDDEKFTLENAEISAIGAVSYVIGSEKSAPRDLNIGIIGYGRIGRELARIFLFLGARVKIFTSKPEVRKELGGYGVESASSEVGFDSCAISGIDVLINTAPTNLAHLFPSHATENMRVIDLATGDSFPGVSGVEYLPSIPENLYPVSGGAAYGKAIKRSLDKRYGGDL